MKPLGAPVEPMKRESGFNGTLMNSPDKDNLQAYGANPAYGATIGQSNRAAAVTKQ